MGKKLKIKLGALIKQQVKVLPEQRCIALNYRCRPAVWESGKVNHVKIGVQSDGSSSVSYDIMLDRKTISVKEKRRAKYEEGYNAWERHIFICVGDDGIHAER